MPFVSAGVDSLDRSPFKNGIHIVFIKSLKNSVFLSTGSSENVRKKILYPSNCSFMEKLKVSKPTCL